MLKPIPTLILLPVIAEANPSDQVCQVLVLKKIPTESEDVTLIQTPTKSSDIDIVSLLLVTHPNSSPEEIYEIKKLCPQVSVYRYFLNP